MYFQNAQEGFVAGATATMLKTGDGGWSFNYETMASGFHNIHALTMAPSGYRVYGSLASGGMYTGTLQILNADPNHDDAPDVSELKRVNLSTSTKQGIEEYSEGKFEPELRRGLNGKIYVNQLEQGSFTYTVGDTSVITNHKHTVKQFDIATTGNITYREEEIIQTETLTKGGDFRRDFMTFDYSPENHYLLYIQKKPDVFTEAPIFFDRLYVYGNTDAPLLADITEGSLSLNAGKAQYGLPLQPHRVYNNTCGAAYKAGYYAKRTVGKRTYEITDHLSNVRLTFSDKRLADKNGDGTPDDPYLNILSWQDYYAFGMIQPGRSNASPSYRFGYQGSEKDDEIHNISGSIVSTYFRQLDIRVGRWWGIDPKSKAWESPYVSMGNNPIWFYDPDGSDTLTFDAAGNYQSKVSGGSHIGLVGDQNSDDGYSFTFADDRWANAFTTAPDPFNDEDDKTKFNSVILIENTTLKNAIRKSGVTKTNNRDDKFSYAWNESREDTRGDGTADMDYTYTGVRPIKDKNPYSLYLTKVGSQIVAHNASNLGNFMWGAGMQKLGFSKNWLKIGANLDAMFNEWRLDSDDDKKSYLLGFKWAKSQTIGKMTK